MQRPAGHDTFAVRASLPLAAATAAPLIYRRSLQAAACGTVVALRLVHAVTSCTGHHVVYLPLLTYVVAPHRFVTLATCVPCAPRR